MSKILPLSIVILFFVSITFSQSRRDLKQRDLRSEVRQINYYDVYRNSNSDSPNSVERWLSAIDVFNRKGNLRVQFGFSYNGKNCLYKKTVYSYDAKNRRTTEMIFQSETGENICPDKPPVFREDEAEELGGKLSLVEKKIYEYGYMGKIIRETIYDNEDKIVQQNSFAYNARGENIRFTITQQKHRISGSSSGFVKTIDFRMFSSDKGKTKETFRYEDGKPVQREIYHKDEKGRTLTSELYRLESDSQNNVVKEIIGFRTKSFYDNEKELLSWTLYDQNGELQTQLYILSENDNELMRLTYNHRKQAKEADQNDEKTTPYQFENISPEIIGRLKYVLKFDEFVENPDWIPARLETRAYKFDASGNVVQYTFQEREKLSKIIKDGSTYEREITYYK